MEFIFKLIFQLDSETANQDELVERLGAEGCTDALIGIGIPGRIGLEFTRDAESGEEALLSAIADVRRAIPTARLIEASPDLVGLTDVADLVKVSRQNMRKLTISHSGTFPAPVHSGSTALYHLDEVLAWLQTECSYEIVPSVIEVAATAKQINLVKEAKSLEPSLAEKVQLLLA